MPSAAARATVDAPIEPAAPGLFSTTTDCPDCSPSFFATSLAMTSPVPPGA
ncbi:Uncharacterised protein [Bordetella pertussis]|nr:Uncharacterised protein [Bordetella pertussis]